MFKYKSREALLSWHCTESPMQVSVIYLRNRGKIIMGRYNARHLHNMLEDILCDTCSLAYPMF